MQNLAQERSEITHFNLQSLKHFWPKSIDISVTTGVTIMTAESVAACSYQTKIKNKNKDSYKDIVQYI